MKKVTQNEQAWDELKACVERINSIDGSKDMPAVENVVRDVVIKIDLLWKKSLGAFKGNSKFDNFNGKYKKIIKDDDLLNYIDVARDVIQHTSQSLLSISQHEIKIVANPDFQGEPSEGSDVEMYYASKNRIKFKHKEDIKLEFSWIPLFGPITNERSKITYLPPKYHMGIDISEHNAITQISFALGWYEKYLISVDEGFPYFLPQ